MKLFRFLNINRAESRLDARVTPSIQPECELASSLSALAAADSSFRPILRPLCHRDAPSNRRDTENRTSGGVGG
jgi:hypothetical protein